MDKFEKIRPFYDSEVNQVLRDLAPHPIVRALAGFTFPDKAESEINEILLSCNSLDDLRNKVVYYAVQHIIKRSTEGLTSSGFDTLVCDKPYLFISNHRDIILDTLFLHVILKDHNLLTTASAIGDNLVRKPLLHRLSKLNRNFTIQRSLTPKEALESSMLVSEYIRTTLFEDKKSVWVAQREGRAKDGNDQTQQGVLKMLSLARGQWGALEYLEKLNIVPIAMSYEFDPTDILKIPELMAKHYQLEYKKAANEDFSSILKGASGQKGRVHFSAGAPINKEIIDIMEKEQVLNKQLQLLKEVIDHSIHKNYKLWPTNYIAHDVMEGSERYAMRYNDKEKRQFDRRIEKRVEANNVVALANFLSMYATPVVNALAAKTKDGLDDDV